MDVVQQEAYEGLRLSWNAWPCNRLEAQRLVVPIVAILTPLKVRSTRASRSQDCSKQGLLDELSRRLLCKFISAAVPHSDRQSSMG